MQENDFEKQVQQKMEELRLKPSAPVWQKIEVQIGQKKKRRTFLFWLLPVLMLTGGIVWWQTSMNNSKSTDRALQSQQINTNKNVATTQENKRTTHLNQKISNQTAAVIEQSPENKISKESSSNFEDNTGVTPNNKIRKINTAIAKQATAFSVLNRSAAAKSNSTYKESKERKNNKRLVAKNTTKNSLPAVAEEHGLLKKLGTDTSAMVADSTINTNEASEFINTKLPPALKDSVPKKAEKNKASRWEWAIASRFGGCQVGDAIFNGVTKKSSRLIAFSSTPNSTTNLPPSPVLTPAQPTRGLSFAVGITAKKSIKNNSNFTVGLQYSYYSTHIKVGSRIDSVNFVQGSNLRQQDAMFLNNNRNTNFTNRYHFIELPIGFEYRLFKKVPLHLHHGISIGRLIKSNAIVYNYSNNRYMDASSQLNKTNINVFTGIDYRVWQNRKVALHLGPQLQYGLTKFSKTTEGKHLWFTGLQASMAF